MRSLIPRSLATRSRAMAVLVAGSALLLTPLSGQATARTPVDQAPDCFVPPAGASAKGGHGADTRDISAAEQKAIEAQTAKLLKAKTARSVAASVNVPVYVHVMRDASGNGDVTSTQITQQIGVLNKTYGGQESSQAANTGFTFTLAGVNKYDNNQWHKDKQSSTYRKKTRQGGKNALNIWLVDFAYLGIATFPWDYARQSGIDGIRVQYTSLPGGSAVSMRTRFWKCLRTSASSFFQSTSA